MMTSFKSMIVVSTLALLMSAVVTAKETKAPAVVTSPAATAAPAAETKAKAAPMDINTASAAELATLPMIGEARAAAIVKGRPYKAKDDLVKKDILTRQIYTTIKDLIIAKQMPMGKNKK